MHSAWRAAGQARRAAGDLAETRPESSARSGLTEAQIVFLLAAPILFASCALLAPQGALIGACALLAALFLILAGLRLAAALTPPRWAERRALPERALPVISLLIALRDEADILPGLAAALDALDYPADRLDILFAIEADDAPTLAAAWSLPRDPRRRILAVPPGRPRTKPRALNYALGHARGALIAVYDAEDRPHPAQLRVAAESFAAAGPELACLQAPLNWYNAPASWLTRQFALEYAAHFHALMPLYARLGWPLPLGGTSNIFRRPALDRAGGWDAWNVTEDADLGFRLAALGYRSALIEPPTFEEAPTRTAPWIRQRTRWLKGYLQTLAVHTRRAPPEGGRIGFGLSLGLTLGAAVLSALLHAPLALLGLAGIAAGAPQAAAAFFLSGYIAAAACAAAGMRRAGLKPRLIDLFRMPAYWPLQTLAALRALRELRHRPYFWDKTRHGLSPPPQGARNTETSAERPGGRTTWISVSSRPSPAWRSAPSSPCSAAGAAPCRPTRPRAPA